MRVFAKDISGEISVIETDGAGLVLSASRSLHHETVSSLGDGDNQDLLDGLELDEAAAGWYNANREKWSYYTPTN